MLKVATLSCRRRTERFESGAKCGWENTLHKLTFTFPTGADFKKASSQALLWADAESLICWVLLFAGQNRARWCEAVGWDSFHLYVFLKLHVDRPGEGNKNITGHNEMKSVFLSLFITVLSL